MFARVTIFQGTPDSVDGAVRFAVRDAVEKVDRPPGLLAFFDLSDRSTGRSAILSLWATREDRAASAEQAKAAVERIAEEGGEKVVAIREYEVGYHLFTEGLLAQS
jgi:heme-degrading monooxygenase HmoA